MGFCFLVDFIQSLLFFWWQLEGLFILFKPTKAFFSCSCEFRSKEPLIPVMGATPLFESERSDGLVV